MTTSTPMSAAQCLDAVRVAAGCAGTGAELGRFTDLHGSWYTTRTLTLDPHPGARSPRLVESASGWVVAPGEPNGGLEHFTGTELPPLVRAGARVIASVSGPRATDLVGLVRRLGHAPGLLGVELNLAPTAPDLLTAQDPASLADLVSQVRAALPGGLLVHVKLGPDHGPAHARLIAGLADALVVTGATAASLPDGRPGHLCGPAILPVTAARVAAVRRVTDVPLIAVGGVGCGADVRALMTAGAMAVQVGSALLHDPTSLDRIRADLTGPR